MLLVRPRVCSISEELDAISKLEVGNSSLPLPSVVAGVGVTDDVRSCSVSKILDVLLKLAV